MASTLLLRGAASGPSDRHRLDERDEEMLACAFRDLISYSSSEKDGAIAHERDGEIVAAWNRDGALRLAQLVPPAYAELSSAILERHRS